MKVSRTHKLGVFLAVFLGIQLSANACTDVRVIAKDNTVVVGRTMEFGADLHSNLRSSPRGRDFTNKTPDGKPAMSWKSKYGYLYVDGMNIDTTVDGMNEKGLSFEYLFFPGMTTYQTIKPGQESQAIPYIALGDWVLGNFASVDELVNSLHNVVVYQEMLPELQNMVFPLHAAIHDSHGANLVIEFINGEMKIYGNALGVMTNCPSFDWQTTNLRNYVNLTPYTSNPVVVDGISFAGTGQGAGMQGLPGDSSPPSRFVKTVFLAKTAIPVEDAAGAVNLVEHILNNVDIPFGFVRAKTAQGDQLESTEWTVFKDLTHQVMYYRLYNDMTLRSISMAQIDFSPAAPHLKMPLKQKPYVMDVTNDFLKGKS